MFEELTHCLTLRLSRFPRTFLTNPSKLRIYRCKIPTVITETLIAETRHDIRETLIYFCKKTRTLVLSMTTCLFHEPLTSNILITVTLFLDDC
jgi:hypothetical protein